METRYDTTPEIMRLLDLFGERRIYWEKETGTIQGCVYWRGYLLRDRDKKLFKGMYLMDNEGRL